MTENNAFKSPMGGSRGGTGGPDPPEKSKKYRVSFLSNTDPDPL